MTKITDLIKDNSRFSFSFEVTPNVSEDELNMSLEPKFFSVTWHAKSHKNENLDIAPLKLANYLRSKGKNVLLHLSCDLLKKEYLNELLYLLEKKDIFNLLVMLGEGYDPSSSDFRDSKELIMYIRERTGHNFCIGVTGHLECSDEILLHLKNKIDVGADFILTQAFFEPNVFKSFSNRCLNIGIRVPIIPGIFYFETCSQLSSFINICKIKVSDNLMQSVKNDDRLPPSKPGDTIIKDLINGINDDTFHHIHFFTMNKLNRVSSFIKKIL